MVHDSLKNYQSAVGLHPLFQKAFDFILQTDFSKLKDGKHEIEGDKLFAAISTIDGKTKEKATLETHNRYIDIQIPLSGIETIGWKAGDLLQKTSIPYSEGKDITFFHDKPTSYSTIHPGEFTIYFPEDGHAPGIGEGEIRKVVLKIEL